VGTDENRHKIVLILLGLFVVVVFLGKRKKLFVPISRKEGGDLLERSGTVGSGLFLEGQKGLLAEVKGMATDFPPLLHLLDDSAVLPTDLFGEIAQDAESTAGFEAENPEGGGDDLFLDPVEGVGHPVVDLEVVESGDTPGDLVREHAPDGPPENLRRCPVMERSPAWVRVRPLPQERQVFQFIPKQ